MFESFWQQAEPLVATGRKKARAGRSAQKLRKKKTASSKLASLVDRYRGKVTDVKRHELENGKNTIRNRARTGRTQLKRQR